MIITKYTTSATRQGIWLLVKTMIWLLDSGGLFSIFPNPASDKIQINFNTIPSNGILFSIRNMQGELVLRRLIQNGEINIDVSGLKNGVYCVGFSSNDNPLQYSKLFVSK
jgi:hypothetical protein